MKPLFPLSLFLLLFACSAPTRESRIAFRDKLKPEEELAHEYLGDVVTAQASEFDGDEEAARRQVRAHAARRGADFVVIESEERRACMLNPEVNCVYLRGKAFRKRSEAELAALSAPPAPVTDSVAISSAAP